MTGELQKIDKLAFLIDEPRSYSYGNKIVLNGAIPDVLEDIHLLEIQLLAIQILESAYLLEKSVNIDTIHDRAHFMKQRIERLIQYKDKHGHSIDLDIELGVDKFRQVYPRKRMRKEALELLRDPGSHIENIELQVQDAIYAGWKRHASDKESQIRHLKNDNAINKRWRDLYEEAELLQLSAVRLTGHDPGYQVYLDRYLKQKRRRKYHQNLTI